VRVGDGHQSALGALGLASSERLEKADGFHGSDVFLRPSDGNQVYKFLPGSGWPTTRPGDIVGRRLASLKRIIAVKPNE
jgi:hypothetical protein